jgi:hypothetical protein
MNIREKRLGFDLSIPLGRHRHCLTTALEVAKQRNSKVKIAFVYSDDHKPRQKDDIKTAVLCLREAATLA